MESDRKTGLDDCSLNELHEVCAVCIRAGALGYLEDQRSVEFLARFCDALDDLHVVDVESADGISAVIGLFEHFLCCYEWHVFLLLNMLINRSGSIFVLFYYSSATRLIQLIDRHLCAILLSLFCVIKSFGGK